MSPEDIFYIRRLGCLKNDICLVFRKMRQPNAPLIPSHQEFNSNLNVTQAVAQIRLWIFGLQPLQFKIMAVAAEVSG